MLPSHRTTSASPSWKCRSSAVRTCRWSRSTPATSIRRPRFRPAAMDTARSGSVFRSGSRDRFRRASPPRKSASSRRGFFSKRRRPRRATTTQAAPALPSDVQNVAAAATATGATTTGEPQVSGVATESGGTIVATGEFISPVRSELAVKVPGRVAKMYVDEGSRISRGQALLELETDYPRLNLEKAQADIARAVSAEQDAQRDLNRKKELIAKESIPQATYD